MGEQHYAYRRFGTADGVPLLQHFRGTMDNWDPLITNGLAAHHDVILFDNAGVGGSSGMLAKSVSDMAGLSRRSSGRSASGRSMRQLPHPGSELADGVPVALP